MQGFGKPQSIFRIDTKETISRWQMAPKSWKINGKGLELLENDQNKNHVKGTIRFDKRNNQQISQKHIGCGLPKVEQKVLFKN